MAVAHEEKEERIAAELEDISAVALCDLDEVVEDPGDRPDELLRAVPASDREALGVGPCNRSRRCGSANDPSIRRARPCASSSLHARTSRGTKGELAVVGNTWHGNENLL